MSRKSQFKPSRVTATNKAAMAFIRPLVHHTHATNAT